MEGFDFWSDFYKERFTVYLSDAIEGFKVSERETITGSRIYRREDIVNGDDNDVVDQDDLTIIQVNGNVYLDEEKADVISLNIEKDQVANRMDVVVRDQANVDDNQDEIVT